MPIQEKKVQWVGLPLRSTKRKNFSIPPTKYQPKRKKTDLKSMMKEKENLNTKNNDDGDSWD